mmetsp:Transcript_3095/g.7610  ORF Transcript_3095/g.7610 Transcript_3095/m.7610 type:complete len:240 (-) Transcript_3095:365-1084(-)
MTYAARAWTHFSIATSLDPPHACSATPTSKGSWKSSIIPHTTRIFRRPAAATRCSATSSDFCFASRRIKRASGKRYASGRVWCAPPQQKSTTTALGLWMRNGVTKSTTFKICCRFRAPRSAGTAPPRVCATSSCGGMLRQSHTRRASLAHLLATRRPYPSAHSSPLSSAVASSVSHGRHGAHASTSAPGTVALNLVAKSTRDKDASSPSSSLTAAGAAATTSGDWLCRKTDLASAIAIG